MPPWLPFGHRAMISARAPSAENGKPDAMPFAMHNTSGSMPACVTANISPGAREPGLHLVGDEQDAVLRAPGREALQERAGAGM